MAPWKSWFSHRGTYLGKDSCFTQRHLESKFGWPGNTLRPATWQEPQSEPKLTDKSLVSIHPLPSNLRPSHNAWQHLWSPSCKSFLPSSRHELAHFFFYQYNFWYQIERMFVDTSRRKFFSQDDTGVSLILCNLLKITSNKFSFVETNMWFAVLTRNRKDLSTMYKSQILGSCWYQLGQVHVPTLWLLIWQDHRFWWLRAKTILNLLFT